MTTLETTTSIASAQIVARAMNTQKAKKYLTVGGAEQEWQKVRNKYG